jgi:hypothetical protein
MTFENLQTNPVISISKEFGIEQAPSVTHSILVKSTAKRRVKSEATVLYHATNNMLRALKQKMLMKDGRVNYEKLRKEGYSDRLLARLEQA